LERDKPAIQVHGLGVTFSDLSGTLETLRDITLDVAQREFLCVLGPSGCGKTTLLRVLAGLLSPTTGSVTFAGRSRPRVSLVFQDSNLMPWRTVMDNILLPMEVVRVDSATALRKASDLVEQVGLRDFADAWPSSLSGGMAQRVAIARALIIDPDLLLLDEPFGSLDALTREKMGADLLRLWQAERKTVVMVTHSISEALLLADRVLVLTPLPGRVRLVLRVELPRPRGMEARYTRAFRELSKELRAAIG